METAKYACDEGYKADVIEAPLVCGKSASWLGEQLICTGRYLGIILLTLQRARKPDFVFFKYIYFCNLNNECEYMKP